METIDSAFDAVPRKEFLPKQEKSYALMDIPLPIGFGQTNSQPTTVRLMLEWLDVKKGQKVLDVGSGSGWTSALLAYLVGAKGQVFAVERIRELVEFGRQNCQRNGIDNIEFVQSNNELGWPLNAPYNRILVSAATNELPIELMDQLSKSGRMVIPIGSEVHVIEKNEKGEVGRNIFTGFAFVPLIRE